MCRPPQLLGPTPFVQAGCLRLTMVVKLVPGCAVYFFNVSFFSVWLARKTIFDLYELYVTSYNCVPVLHNNQHSTAQIFQKNDILRYSTVDARSDLDHTVQRRPTKAYNAKIENAHVYLVHILSSNYLEIHVRNYVTSFSTSHMISLFWNFSCTYNTRKIYSLECFASCICPFKGLEHSNKAYFMRGSRWGPCRGSTSTVHMRTTTSE
jgi:hypothetical protein